MASFIKMRKRKYKGVKWIDTRLSIWYRKKQASTHVMAAALTSSCLCVIKQIKASDMDKISKAIKIAQSITDMHISINKVYSRLL
jgi:hypothetical protein